MNMDSNFDMGRAAHRLPAFSRSPGHNVDRIDVGAGLIELAACGYEDVRTCCVIEYALQRWARGGEEAAERGAIDRSFHGIDLTSWRRVLAAARASAEHKAGGQQ